MKWTLGTDISVDVMITTTPQDEALDRLLTFLRERKYRKLVMDEQEQQPSAPNLDPRADLYLYFRPTLLQLESGLEPQFENADGTTCPTKVHRKILNRKPEDLLPLNLPLPRDLFVLFNHLQHILNVTAGRHESGHVIGVRRNTCSIPARYSYSTYGRATQPAIQPAK